MQSINSKFTKALLAAALAGAFAAPAMAQSSVAIGGLVDTFVGSMRNAGDTASKAVVGSGGMTTSYIGFSGVEDLGNGLKAKFALNAFFLGDTGAGGRFPGNETLFSRDANVGLAGGFGEVQFGRGLAPNFLPTVIFNPLGDSFTFSPLVMHSNVPLFNASGFTSSLAGDTGWSNQIKYTTPSIGGLTANLHYQLGEAAGNTSKNNVGANFLYFNGALSLGGYYHKVQVNNPLDTPAGNVKAGATEQKVTFVGAGYDFGLAKLFATYDKSSHNTKLEDKTTSFGLSVPVSGGKVLAAYAQTKRTVGTPAEVRRETSTVGYDYFVSKRTDLYAMLMSDKITGYAEGTSFGVGMRHRF